MALPPSAEVLTPGLLLENADPPGQRIGLPLQALALGGGLLEPRLEFAEFGIAPGDGGLQRRDPLFLPAHGVEMPGGGGLEGSGVLLLVGQRGAGLLDPGAQLADLSIQNGDDLLFLQHGVEALGGGSLQALHFAMRGLQGRKPLLGDSQHVPMPDPLFFHGPCQLGGGLGHLDAQCALVHGQRT